LGRAGGGLVRRSTAAILGLALAACVAMPLPAAAQETRAELLRAQRAAKARRTVPHDPGFVEKMFSFVGERESGGKPLGFYPYVGSVYTGGAVAFGAGYRVPFKDTGSLETEAAISPKLYWKVDARLRLPEFFDRRVRVEARAIYLDAPKINFFGIGSESSEDDRTTFRLTAGALSTTVLVRPAPWLGVGGGLDYLVDDTGRGKTGPSIEEVFGPDEVPGLGVDPNYTVLRAFAQVDTRRVSGDIAGGRGRGTMRVPARVRDLAPGYATRGGFARADVAWFSAEDNVPYSFRRFDGGGGYLIPLLRDNWVIALRGLVSLTGTDTGQEVPYYLMPTLGYSRDLRGFDNFRFRDRNRLLMTAEYRWTPSRLLDVVLFYDTGKVAPRAGDLDFSGLESDYGFGLRFHTRNETLVRFELAKSDEKLRFIFGVGPSF
jgi:hypothetical protein